MVLQVQHAKFKMAATENCDEQENVNANITKQNKNNFMWKCNQLTSFPWLSLEIECEIIKPQFCGFRENVKNKV